VLIAIYVPASLHSQAMYVAIFNGFNFSDWNKQVQFHLSMLDLYMVFHDEKLATITLC